MSAVNRNFKTHYLAELDALHREGREFALSHPDVAKELGMSAEFWKDPQAEMLAQSFAFLTARIRNQLDIDRYAVPNALLDHLYPHLQAPIPSMAVMEADVVGQSANGRAIERNRVFTIEAKSRKRTAQCRFSSCYRTPVWPLLVNDVRQIENRKTAEKEALDGLEGLDVGSIVKVGIQSMSDSLVPIGELDIGNQGLRLHIPGRHATARHLYELLCTSLLRIQVVIPGQEVQQTLSPENVRWLGFNDDEAALPDKAQANPGYRLLQEYFAFPEKFMFFEINGIDVTGAANELLLYFVFEDPVSSEIELNRESLKLNCFPAVNLFKQSIEPIRLTRRKYEYPVEVDRSNLENFEVYRIESLYSVVHGEAPREIMPCYDLSAFDAEVEDEYFYAFRREQSLSDMIPGTRSFISLMDMDMDICEIPAETIGGRALCTNRRLAESLLKGNVLDLEGAGPVKTVSLISKVSGYRAPKLDGNAPWQLVSRLSLNLISLVDRQGRDQEHGMETFKSILHVYTDTQNPMVWKQINSLKTLTVNRVARYIQDGRHSRIGHGLELKLTINEDDFKGISPVLLASVCRYFFALYSNLGTFTELTLLRDNKDQGEWKRWPPMAGALVDL